MRVVIQRVLSAQVSIDEKVYSEIKDGLVILLGVEENDNFQDVEWLSNKILNLRIFDNENGNMNLSVSDIEGDILVISQFTLHAKTKKGNRPSFINAAKPEIAQPLYEQFVQKVSNSGLKIKTGVFGADMQVDLTNNGPVTIVMDSKNKDFEASSNGDLTLEKYQKDVDNWIKNIGVRYFDELTNTAILMEEVGEVARIMARRYGEQSEKGSDKNKDLGDELADVLFVLTCLANQTGIDLSAAIERNFQKKTNRDFDRHRNNKKIN